MGWGIRTCVVPSHSHIIVRSVAPHASNNWGELYAGHNVTNMVVKRFRGFCNFSHKMQIPENGGKS